MAQAASSSDNQAVAKAGEEAVIALAQLAFVAFALRASDPCISTLAASVFRYPSAAVGTPNTKETPDQRAARRGRIVAVLESVKGHAEKMANRQDLFNPGHLGGVANKMVITHAVAVLEAFLDDAAEPFKKRLKSWPLPRSFHRKCKDLKCAGVADLSRLCGHAEADILAEVRHVIVHRNGEVDCKLLAAVAASRSPLARVLVGELSVRDQVSIPIDTFVLPALLGALEFVHVATEELGNNAASGTGQST